MRLFVNRREWLRCSGAAGLGMLSANLARASSRNRFPGFGRAKSVLIIHTSGGMSQFETWDPKPAAAEEIRGAFGTIATSVPGIRFGEHMPRIAKLANRFTVVRSMSHDDTDHGSATYLALTGQFHSRKSSNPLPTPNDYPTLGAVLKRVRPEKQLPHTAVHINGPVLAPRLPAAGQFGGVLGRFHEPLVLGDVTHDQDWFHGMEPRIDLPSTRLDERKGLLNALDSACQRMEPNAGRDASARKAFELLSSARYRRAFDLDQEPERLRERYGVHRSGQACLLGRRLVEAGMPWVTVFFNHGIRGQDWAPDDTDQYGWDTHYDIFHAMRRHLLPRFDESFSTLLEDLDNRGLLDTTLVVCMGEFGRAPLVAVEKNVVGTTPGRKHWAACYSIVLAGAGIARGATYGASDRTGAYPSENPVTPGDLVATKFAALGIDPSGHYEDGTGRRFDIAAGKPVGGLYG
jgi:hypothetical protein